LYNGNNVTSASSANALYLSYANNSNVTNTLTNATGTGYSVYLDNSANNIFSDSVFDSNSSISRSINSVDTGSNNFTNCTFNKSSIDVTGTADVNVFWYMNIHTINYTGSNLGAVTLTISSASGVSLFSGITNSTGWLLNKPVQEFKENATAIYNYTSQYFNASKSGYAANNTAFALSDNYVGANVLNLTLNVSAATPTPSGGGGGGAIVNATPVIVTPSPVIVTPSQPLYFGELSLNNPVILLGLVAVVAYLVWYFVVGKRRKHNE
jgi:hypothetical protein